MLLSVGIHSKHSPLSVTQLAKHLKFQWKESSCWPGNYEKMHLRGAHFWWQLSLTTLFSNIFHGALHGRKGFLSSELSSCQAERNGDSFLWTQVEKAPQWRASQRENAKPGKRMQAAYLCVLPGTSSSMWSCVLPYHLAHYCSYAKDAYLNSMTGQNTSNVTLAVSRGHCSLVWL